MEGNRMNSLAMLATFFGWCTVINVGILLFSLLMISLLKDWIGKISARLFGITEEAAKATFFQVFQQYRFSIVLLNLVPYIALKIMAG